MNDFYTYKAPNRKQIEIGTFFVKNILKLVLLKSQSFWSIFCNRSIHELNIDLIIFRDTYYIVKQQNGKTMLANEDTYFYVQRG